MMNKTRPLVMFDLDGTIVDSANEVLHCLNIMRKKRSLPDLEKGELLIYMGHGASSLLQAAFINLNESIEELVTEFRILYAKTQTPKSSLYSHVKATLESLSSDNCYLAIVTNKPENLCHKVLKELELEHYFDYVIANNGQFAAKPAADAIHYLINHFDTEPGISYMVGDTTLDQCAAREAGVNFVFFSAGYDDGVELSDNDVVLQCMSDFNKKINLN